MKVFFIVFLENDGQNHYRENEIIAFMFAIFEGKKPYSVEKVPDGKDFFTKLFNIEILLGDIIRFIIVNQTNMTH